MHETFFYQTHLTEGEWSYINNDHKVPLETLVASVSTIKEVQVDAAT